MASNKESKFPAQSQKTQPGKEHVMNPLPQEESSLIDRCIISTEDEGLAQ